MPRLQVSLILMLTGMAGFLISFTLLHAGISWMWLRYPLAILFAYSIFLLLLRLWLSFQRTRNDNSDTIFDLPAPDINSPDVNFSKSPGAVTDNFKFSGRGGDAGGAGAGGSWGENISSSSSTSASSGGSSSGGIDFDLDLDDAAWLVLAVIALLGALIAALYVVYIAPALLAEILVDGVLVTGLYKRLKGIERRHWLLSAVRRTLLPALIVAIFFSIAGYAMQRAAPDARSIGEVWQSIG